MASEGEHTGTATGDTSPLEPFLVEKSGVAETLRAVIEPSLDARGIELVELVLVRGKTRSKLRLFVDKKGAGGIGLDDLERVNRTLSDLLDVEDAHRGLFSSAYDLEVSSPGVDRPLTKRSHLAAHIGKRVRLRTKTPVEGARQHTGVIASVDDRGLTLSIDGGPTIRVDDALFESAHVVFDFGSSTAASDKRSQGDGPRRKAWKAKS